MASVIMESLFQRSLEDLVKGLRVQMIGEARYVAKALEEIRKEIKSVDANTKAVALQKLTYLNMLHGVDMEWAAFHVVEVMSMPKFSNKKLGYLAASQSFHEGTDVLLLITNLLRKDLNSTNEHESGLALECLSRIATPDLARDLTPEIFTTLASSRLSVRKKSILVFHKIFSMYPDAVRIAFKRLVEKLEDPEPQVVCAAVSILCEMAMKDPKSYLPLAPEFYKLLVDSTNNWLLIKVMKIFGVLSTIEPRLGRKIAEPLCEHMRRTGAKSLLLECIRTIVVGLPDHAGAVKLAVEKLKDLLAEEDPNLKYLGLQALASLMPVHPWAVAENKEIIVRSLSDGDLSIQMASLRLILGMVSETNVIETVQVLMQFAKKSDPNFCNELIGTILATCSRGFYELITDFSWYVCVLGEIAKLSHCNHGKEVERQLVDIGMRVKAVRGDLINVARALLLDPTLLGHSSLHGVLSAAAWIAGEYVEFSQNPFELIEALLQPRTKLLPPTVHAVYLQAVLKVFVFYAYEHLKNLDEKSGYQNFGDMFSCTDHVESSMKLPVRNEPGTSASDNRNVEESLLVSSVERLSVAKVKSAPFIQEIAIRDESSSNTNKQQMGIFDEPLDKLVEVIKVNVGPLEESVDVEVQERACNLFGLLRVLENYLILLGEELICSSKSRCNKLQISNAFEILKFAREIFSQELGPVSVFAQRRVVVPHGLRLLENLDSLGPVSSDEEVSENKWEWNFGKPPIREWEDGPVFVQRQDTSQAGESVSFLAQHRQQHETYYLPSENVAVKNTEYPPPQVAESPDIFAASAVPKDLLKLTEQSFLWTKQRRPKARPVVVRLDEVEEMPLTSVKSTKDLKDDLISNAIRDVLAGDKSKQTMKSVGLNGSENREGVSSMTSHRHHRRSHRSVRHHDATLKAQNSGTELDGKLISKIDHGQTALAGLSEAAETDNWKGEKKSSRSHRHAKQTKGFSKDVEIRKEEFNEDRQQEGASSGRKHHKSGRRSRHQTRSPVNLSPHTPVIPDFLL